MKILLTTLNAKYIHINLAIRLLYELNQDHKGLDMKEFTIKEDKDDVADFCQSYDVVAFSCYIWNISQTLAVAQRIKARHPHIKILLGGPEVSYDWQDIIVKPEVDYIITGEGEIPFRAFLDSYPHIEHITNLVRKIPVKQEAGTPNTHPTEGSIFYLPMAQNFDLSAYRDINPYRTDSAEELYNKVCYIETSRGCPYKCSFCLASLDNKVRYLPNETIKAHLLHLMQHGRVIKFLDRTFNIKRDFTLDIFNFILQHHRPENVFQFEITADILHPDIIQFIQERVPKGLFRFEIGIQTVNQKANLEVSRKQSFEKTKSIILQLRDKVEMHLDLIVGLPLDYWADIKYSFEEVFKLFPPELQLGFLKFLKGTPVRHDYEKHGFRFDPEPPYQIIESQYLSREELRLIEVVENALEIYWNKNRARHTLRYVTGRYSIFDFLLGLGSTFEAQRPFHKYTLADVYETLFDYASHQYRDDTVLLELIAIDYYLFYKIKPKSLFINEIPRPDKFALIQERGLNHHQYRFMVFPISFDFSLFEQTHDIELTPSLFIVQYDGLNKASVVYSDKQLCEL